MLPKARTALIALGLFFAAIGGIRTFGETPPDVRWVKTTPAEIYDLALDQYANCYVTLNSYQNAIAIGATTIQAKTAVAKFDATGALQWLRGLDSGVDNWRILPYLAVAPSGVCYVIGSDAARVQKFSSGGVPQGGFPYDFGLVTGIALGANNNLYICGQRLPSTAALAAYNSDGAFLWSHNIAATTARWDAIAVTPAGDILVTGYLSGIAQVYPVYASYNDYTDLWLARYGNNGRLAAITSVGGAGSEYGYGVVAGLDNSLWFVGQSGDEGFWSGGAFMVGPILGRVTGANSIYPLRTINTLSTRGIARDRFGSLYTADTVRREGASQTQAQISRFDSAGNHLWSQSMGGASDDGAFKVAAGPNGEFYLAGYFRGAASFGQFIENRTIG